MSRIIKQTVFALSIILNFGLSMAYINQTLTLDRTTEASQAFQRQWLAADDKLQLATGLAAEQATSRIADVDQFKFRLEAVTQIAKHARAVAVETEAQATQLVARAKQAADAADQTLAVIGKANNDIAFARLKVTREPSPPELATR